MTVDQALDVIKAIRPKIFYPYHYGGTKTKTDMKRLETEAKVYTDVRIKGME
jgi:L-ascorbate metabolism protein UlaG (beta-lactamase superfamily)